MPGTTLRLDDVEHKMLQMLSLKTGRTQNQILVDLLRQEFARHGLTRERIEEMLADPDRFWKALGRPAPDVPDQIHEKVLADLAALDEEPGRQAAAA